MNTTNIIVSVAKPTVLIPAIPARASAFVLNILTVDVLTTLTKYGSPSESVPVIVLLTSYALPIPIDGFRSYKILFDHSLNYVLF